MLIIISKKGNVSTVWTTTNLSNGSNWVFPDSQKVRIKVANTSLHKHSHD